MLEKEIAYSCFSANLLEKKKKYIEKKRVKSFILFSSIENLLNLDFKKDIIKHGQLNIRIHKGLTEYSYGT